jgi:hypothetical protein
MADLAVAYCNCSFHHANLSNHDQALVRCSQSIQTWDKVVKQMGMREHIDRYYEARLTRLGLHLQKGDDSSFAGESRVLANELRNVASVTGNKHLAALYQDGCANGYW